MRAAWGGDARNLRARPGPALGRPPPRDGSGEATPAPGSLAGRGAGVASSPREGSAIHSRAPSEDESEEASHAGGLVHRGGLRAAGRPTRRGRPGVRRDEIGSCAVGRGFATTDAPCEDASSLYWNPGATPAVPRGLSLYAGAACAPYDDYLGAFLFTLTRQTLGTAGVLDPAERAAITARVGAYNAYLRSTAASLNWACYDPNTTTARPRASGAINPAPLSRSLATGQPNTNPWGSALSLDSFHASASGRLEIANDIIRVLNQFYQSSIPPAPLGPI